MTHIVGKSAPSSQRFKQIGQYAISPGHMASCYAELVVFFPSGGRTIANTHCAYPRRDSQAELTWVAGYTLRQIFPHRELNPGDDHPSKYQPGPV